MAPSLLPSLAAASSLSIPAIVSSQTQNQRIQFKLSSSERKWWRQDSKTRTRFNLCPKAISLRSNAQEAAAPVDIPSSVPVRVANELLQAGHRYLDVRTPEEFIAGHPRGAINIPYMYTVNGSGMMIKNDHFMEQVSRHFRKHDEIIVGCQSGKRSMMAAKDLVIAGFYGIVDLVGGYAAWTHNGLPTD